jgi:hypothetical protein
MRHQSLGLNNTAAPALPGACLDHQYRALHGHVAGAVQGYLALSDEARFSLEDE